MLFTDKAPLVNAAGAKRFPTAGALPAGLLPWIAAGFGRRAPVDFPPCARDSGIILASFNANSMFWSSRAENESRRVAELRERTVMPAADQHHFMTVVFDIPIMVDHARGAVELGARATRQSEPERHIVK